MEEVTAGVYLVSINRSRYSAVYGWGPCENGFPSRGHQRGSASAAAQAWLEKEIYSSNSSKTNIRKYGPSKNKLNRPFVALDQMHHLREFAAPGQKNKLVEIC